MQITDIRIRKINTEGRMKAVVSVTFDDAFVVHDIKVIEGQEGRLFTAMPSRKTPDGEYKDIAHPINSKRKLNNFYFPGTLYAGECLFINQIINFQEKY